MAHRPSRRPLGSVTRSAGRKAGRRAPEPPWVEGSGEKCMASRSAAMCSSTVRLNSEDWAKRCGRWGGRVEGGGCGVPPGLQTRRWAESWAGQAAGGGPHARSSAAQAAATCAAPEGRRRTHLDALHHLLVQRPPGAAVRGPLPPPAQERVPQRVGGGRALAVGRRRGVTQLAGRGASTAWAGRARPSMACWLRLQPTHPCTPRQTGAAAPPAHLERVLDQQVLDERAGAGRQRAKLGASQVQLLKADAAGGRVAGRGQRGDAVGWVVWREVSGAAPQSTCCVWDCSYWDCVGLAGAVRSTAAAFGGRAAGQPHLRSVRARPGPTGDAASTAPAGRHPRSPRARQEPPAQRAGQHNANAPALACAACGPGPASWATPGPGRGRRLSWNVCDWHSGRGSTQ